MKKLIAIQSELNAPKNQYNSFGGYKYRSCEDIIEAVKPLCLKHECLISISDSIELIGDRYYICATATFINGDFTISSKGYAREPLEKKKMDASQITGAASSYARKYALNGLLFTDDSKDADTDEYKKVSSSNENNSKASYSKGTTGEALIDTVCKIVDNCKSEKEVTAIWNDPKYKIIKSNKRFIAKVTEVGTKLKNK